MPEENLAPDVSPDSPYRDEPEAGAESAGGAEAVDPGARDAGGDADPVLDELSGLGEAGDILLVEWGDMTGEKLASAKTNARAILGDVSPEARNELIEAFDAMPAAEQAKIFRRLASQGGRKAPSRGQENASASQERNRMRLQDQIEAKRAERAKAQANGKHDRATSIDKELMALYRQATGPDEVDPRRVEGRIPLAALTRSGL